MLGSKEVDIIQALVEEEIIRSNSVNDSTVSNIMEQYRHTLIGIEGKLHSLQNSYRDRVRVY